ncbi:hypothetical protein N7501_000996, partial [Penicillium viridicatum]
RHTCIPTPNIFVGLVDIFVEIEKYLSNRITYLHGDVINVQSVVAQLTFQVGKVPFDPFLYSLRAYRLAADELRLTTFPEKGRKDLAIHVVEGTKIQRQSFCSPLLGLNFEICRHFYIYSHGFGGSSAWKTSNGGHRKTKYGKMVACWNLRIREEPVAM